MWKAEKVVVTMMDFLYFFVDYLSISDKYLPALVCNLSSTLLFYICLCVTMLLLTWTSIKKRPNGSSSLPQPPKSDNQFKGSFGPEDEVTFTSSVSQKEIDEQIAKNTPGIHIPLAANDTIMKRQINALVGDANGSRGTKEDLVQRVKRSRQLLRKKIETEMTDEDKATEREYVSFFIAWYFYIILYCTEI